MGFGKGKWKEMVKSKDKGMRKSKLEKRMMEEEEEWEEGGGRMGEGRAREEGEE